MGATIAPLSRRHMGMKAGRRLWMAVSYVVMVLLGVMFLFPWFYTLMTSLMAANELYMFPPKFIPTVPQFRNYAFIFKEVPFGLWFLNSMQVVALSVIGGVLSATVVGYSFARFRWRGRDLIFGITLATMMLPADVTLIPRYLLFRYPGWLNTLKPLWVPAWFGGGAFAIFLFRQFIMTLPRELDEAAIIDGANPFRILVMVLLPLMQPVLATMAVLSFIGAWNDFMGPLIYLNSPKKFTVALGLRYFQQTPGSQAFGTPTQHYLMGCCVLSALPIIILFFAAQKYFVQGIVMSGLKG